MGIVFGCVDIVRIKKIINIIVRKCFVIFVTGRMWETVGEEGGIK